MRCEASASAAARSRAPRAPQQTAAFVRPSQRCPLASSACGYAHQRAGSATTVRAATSSAATWTMSVRGFISNPCCCRIGIGARPNGGARAHAGSERPRGAERGCGRSLRTGPGSARAGCRVSRRGGTAGQGERWRPVGSPVCAGNGGAGSLQPGPTRACRRYPARRDAAEDIAVRLWHAHATAQIQGAGSTGEAAMQSSVAANPDRPAAIAARRSSADRESDLLHVGFDVAGETAGRRFRRPPARRHRASPAGRGIGFRNICYYFNDRCYNTRYLNAAILKPSLTQRSR